jgi:hypothetical protein
MCPYPMTARIGPSFFPSPSNSPACCSLSRILSTSEYILPTGTERSYLYTDPALPLASGRSSRNDHREENWVWS